MILERNQNSFISVVAVWNVNFFIYFLYKQLVFKDSFKVFFCQQVARNQTQKKQIPSMEKDFETMYCASVRI